MTKPTGIALAVLLAVSAADAQVSGGRYGPARQATATQKGIQQEPKPERVIVVVDRPRNSNVMPTPNGQPVPVKLIPALLMSDGSILADFGFGMERVTRACAGVVVTPGRVLGGNGQVLSQPAPQLQPVPRMQPAPGMQPAPAQSQNQGQLSRAALGSCFARDASGRVFATQ